MLLYADVNVIMLQYKECYIEIYMNKSAPSQPWRTGKSAIRKVGILIRELSDDNDDDDDVNDDPVEPSDSVGISGRTSQTSQTRILICLLIIHRGILLQVYSLEY